jgi:hypothetical protein
MIEKLGGDTAHYGEEENPQSKSAKEDLDGSRV